MCGRFSLAAPPDEVRHIFGYAEQPNFPARYNIAPTQPVPIVRLEQGARHFRLVRWGLIPGWVKDPNGFTLLINARSETAAEKPAFRLAMKRRRCLVPASGFYEWQRLGKTAKQPFWVRPRDGGLFGFAGLWEHWMGPEGSEMESVAILTAPANDTLAPIHHRMPIAVTPSNWDRWLDCSADEANSIQDVLKDPANDFWDPVPVSDRVNKVREDDAGLQEAVEPAPMPEDEGGSHPASGQMDLF